MSVGNDIFKGMVWSAVERISVQAVQFVLGIVLARLLTPTEYGTIGLLMVFIVLSQVFIDSGFSKALIQKKDRNEDDKSTVFLFNIGIAIVSYIILWFSAPFIADFYKIETLTLLLRVLALSLVINALFSVPGTMIVIAMNFKLFTKINLTTTIISGLIAVGLAYLGYGVWALVFQVLLKGGITAILIWFVLKWKPNFVFSISSFRKLFSFGSKLLLSSLMASFSSQINSLLIGKYIGAKDLGFYSRGIQFSDIVYGIFTSALSNVLLPGLSPLQDNKEVLVSHTRTIIKTSAVIVIPVFFTLAVLAEPIILVLLTDKWIAAAPIMQAFCIGRLISIISEISINILYVVGKTGLVLKQQYYNIAIRIVLLLFALQFGIIYIAMAEVLSTTIHFFINTYYPGKIMNYGALKQLKDIFPIMMSGVLMAVLIIASTYFVENDILKLCIAPLVAIPSFLGMMYLLKVKEYQLILEKVKGLIASRK